MRLMLKLKSSDQCLWLYTDKVDELDPTYKFWRFRDQGKKGTKEMMVAVDDVSFIEITPKNAQD